ncbi:retrovirus-related pol polyprotein from transposon TNT 1-94 [Tanacetum coccineum]
MDSDKNLKGQSMQRSPIFENDSFIYWKNRFETYVKSKDLDLWHVITNGDFQPIEQNPKTKLDVVIPFEKQSDDLKKKLAKNNEPKMAKKESGDEECSTSRSEDEEYAMAVRDFKKCGDPNHLIGECPKPPKDKNQRAFVKGSWSDSGEEDYEMVKNKTCLVAQASTEICLGVDLEPDEWIKDSGCSKHMMGNRKLFSSYKAYNGGNVIFGSNLRGNIIGKGQICDNKCRVTFSEHDSEITKDGKVISRVIRKKRRLGHANMRVINSLASKELVRNLPKLRFDQHFCDACKIGKQAHASHKAKNIVSTTRCLELIYMDLFGTPSYGVTEETDTP